ncbi:LAQU0S03e08548g1_1 [Lachancea quebecensis]|uniref:LAQU0S03e08548g1_1 n=1 Tax=Lachancea quebecensis TaxID=1654605 RepID=A0A0P1KQ40_9SACH|nr:LAQU0S03e08548g1_1 [Lachancea quebecensis]
MSQLNGELQKLIKLAETGYLGKEPIFLKSLQSQREKGASVSAKTKCSLCDLLKANNDNLEPFKWQLADITVQVVLAPNTEDFESENRGYMWSVLMRQKCWSTGDFDSHFLKTLIDFGLDFDEPHSWKCIALLLEIAADEPKRCKPVLASMLQVKYRKALRDALENTRDFQLASTLIRLLGFLFPRKTPPVPVHSQYGLQIWDEPYKNESFFNDPSYPSKNGSSLEFVLKKMGPFPHFGHLKSFSFVTGSPNGETKAIKSASFVQCTDSMLYIWTTGLQLVEFQLKHLEVTKCAVKGGLRLRLLNLRSTMYFPVQSVFSTMSSKASSLIIVFEDVSLAETCLRSMRRHKISEVESFIAFPSNSSITETSDSASPKNLENPTYTPPPNKTACSLSNSSSSEDNKNAPNSNELVLQLKSDEWGFDSPIDTDKSANSHSVHGEANSSRTSGEEPNADEHSPLVLMQKRKQARAGRQITGVVPPKLAMMASSENKAKEGAPLNLDVEKSDNATTSVTAVGSRIQKQRLPKPKLAGSIKQQDLLRLESIFNSAGPKTNFRRPKDMHSVPRNTKHEKTPHMDHKLPVDPQKLHKRRAEDTEVNPANTKRVAHAAEEDASEEASEACNISAKAALASTKAESRSLLRVPATKAKPLLHRELTKAPPSPEITNFESTTIGTPSGILPGKGLDYGDNSFTNKLQEQIFKSVTCFSEELVKRIEIVNEELNNKVFQELSEKYQRMFDQLQASFQSDVSNMSRFVGEIKDLLHLPEDQLIKAIRKKKFN